MADAPPVNKSAVIALLASSATVPFIARYRTAQTGGATPEQIREIRVEWLRVQALDARRAAIVKRLIATGLTSSLRRRLDQARSLVELEDIYAPFKTKRKTRAAAARERGIEPLCSAVWRSQLPPHALRPRGLDAWARQLTGECDAAVAFALAADLLASYVAGAPDVVAAARATCAREAKLRARPKKAAKGGRIASGGVDAATFRSYFEFEECVRRCRPHQLLALNRGAAVGALSVALAMPAAGLAAVRTATARLRRAQPRDTPRAAAMLRAAEQEAWTRLLKPSLSRALRKDATARAHAHATKCFVRNVRSALLAPPLPRRRVLGVDPAFRSGCKLAAVDERGVVLRTAVVHPHAAGAAQRDAAARTTAAMARELDLDVAAIGNGTACRETEQWLAALIRSGALPADFKYTIVSEAGASVYSASPLAAAEFPTFTPAQIGAVTIARRLQDPLLELVKVAPASIGVGLYQHDLPPAQLADALDGAVQDAVALVGVDVNSASEALLRRVPGLNAARAKALRARCAARPLAKRADLLTVHGIGANSYEQCAGFLRVVQPGADPLDGTCVHPEAYGIATELLRRAGVAPRAVLAPAGSAAATQRRAALQRVKISPELLGALRDERRATSAAARAIGERGIRDVLKWLVRGAGDEARAERSESVFRRDVVRFDQLEVGLLLSGVVRNVVDFGAFVDVGLKSDAMLHLSAMGVAARGDPHNVVSVGMVLELFVISLDAQRGRVGLGTTPPGAPAVAAAAAGECRALRTSGAKKRPRPSARGSAASATSATGRGRGRCSGRGRSSGRGGRGTAGGRGAAATRGRRAGRGSRPSGSARSRGRGGSRGGGRIANKRGGRPPAKKKRRTEG